MIITLLNSMVNYEPLSSLISILEQEDDKFIPVLERIIKAGIKIVNNAEELREELSGYDDIYQTSILDVGYNYWLDVLEGKLFYKKGFNPEAKFKVSYTKELIINILKGKISGTDAFMKGQLRVEGDLSQGLHYVKIFRLFVKYLKKKNGMDRTK